MTEELPLQGVKNYNAVQKREFSFLIWSAEIFIVKAPSDNDNFEEETDLTI